MTNLSDLFPAGAGKQVSFVAGGAISAAGKPVILNSAGTVTQVAEASVAVDIPYITTSSSGSVWDATATRTYSTLQFDPLVTGRMLVGYNDATGYPSVIVGEQDGSSITWGVSTVLVSVYTTWSVALAFDPANTNQFVAQYYDATATDIEAVSGTITGSGATAAFTLGTAVQLYNGAPTQIGPQYVAFDPSNSATVLFLYHHSATATKLRAATISSNVITLGTEQDCGTTADPRPYNSIAFNSAGTFAFSYVYASGSNKIETFTGSISGTTISLSAAATTIALNNSPVNALCQFDPNNDNKLAFAYYTAATYATGEIVTLSGSGAAATITAGTAITYYSAGLEVGYQCLFNSGTAGEIVFVYQQSSGDGDIAARAATYDDSSTSNTITLGTVYTLWDTSATGFPQARYPAGCVNGIFGVTFVRDDDHDGTVVLGKMTTTATNLTATNFIGISDAAISDTASGNVTVKGGIAATGLTSLTPGSDYYVQNDGSLAAGVTSIPYDISGATFVDAFSVSSQESDPRGIAFNTDGTKMFIVGSGGDEVNQYALSTGFDVSTASFTQTFSVAAQEIIPEAIAFNTDGTKMFITGLNGDDVNEYALSTGFDVSTASFTDAFSVAGQETAPTGLSFNTDGTKMFIVGEVGVDVNEYALTTGFDVSTASFTDSFSIASQEAAPQGLAFSTDGTKMFVVGDAGNDVNEYTLSTGFDVSTASFTTLFSVAGQDTSPRGLTFNNNGTKMFVVGGAGVDVNEYAVTQTTFVTTVKAGRAMSATSINLEYQS